MSQERESLNFLEHKITADLAEGKYNSVLTRFPPEPNGYLHIGHVKAIWISFGLAEKFGGKTNLRFDDTNPTTEETEFVESIQNDIKWLGYEWDALYFASDYFEQLYQYAIQLINKGLAYVDDSTSEEIAGMKGTPTQAGVNSPYRDRSIEENLALFEQMKNGEFPDGSKVLRAKIDMAHPNMLMRDPLIYRIKHEAHHRTGEAWKIYPMYDFAHGQSDSIENITHSLCSLEFIHHRPLYNWFIEQLEIFPSEQTEFARMNVSYMITSKRKLKRLIEGNYVTGWDDPRMPTVAGMRRKGYPAAALRTFCEKTGVAKRNNLQEIALLESCIRDELNRTSDRIMVVKDPIKLTITNYPDEQTEVLEAINNPEDDQSATREIMFSKHLLIERSDYMEAAPKKFFRLTEGRNVRLKNAYIIHCDEAIKDSDGNVSEILCTYYPNSKSGEDVSGIKSKGTLHWVSEQHAIDCEVRDYDRLFKVENPGAENDFLEDYNEASLQVISHAKMEAAAAKYQPGDTLQFMRIGYYAVDPESTADKLVFNRTVTLKDTWSKGQKR